MLLLLSGCATATASPTPAPALLPSLSITAVATSIASVTPSPILQATNRPATATLSPLVVAPTLTSMAVATAAAAPTLPTTAPTQSAVATMAPAPTRSASSAPAATSDIAGVQSFSGLGQNHVPFPVNYPMRPPVGGDHVSVWQNCGIYEEPVIDEQAVHSMEHGAVWIAYQPSLALPAVQKLRSYARGNAYVLMSPYPGLSHAVVLTAWGLQLRLIDVNDPRIALFVSKHANGPQTPEKGARCSGGVGSPVER